jgi:adenylate cyclase
LVFERRVFRAMSYGRLILIKSGSYVLLFIIVLLFANIISSISYYGYFDLDLWINNIRDIFFLIFLVMIPYILLVSILINLTKQIDLKFGPGNLKNLLLGRFHHPRQDHRIFMFLDMRSSTTIAEELGHIQFSRLIQDCFTDLTVVRDYKAEFYQYVGDEAVLSWSLENGLEDLNCINAYFAFQNLLEKRGDYYKKKYGLIPIFKAGLNVGDVTLAEVGQIKREIAFHGDTLNTAARIEGMCNEYNKNILLSQGLKEMLNDHEDFQIDEVGEFLLRGKAKPSKIYSIEHLDDSKK